jgi:RNA-directed DNA polymerase
MSREVHVRFREGAGVRLPRATRLVIGCEREDDARRILAVLPKRFARFKLTIHPQKTRLVGFQPPRGLDEGECGDGTCDFLGLTHYWAKSRRGYWVITRLGGLVVLVDT